MKSLFPGYFKADEQDIKAAWSNCLFIFDANILLNLYRYSDSTRNEFLKIFGKLKSRICLPHRAAEEYFLNRIGVIDTEESRYDDTKKLIDSLKKNLENTRMHPFVSEETMQQVNVVFESLNDELLSNKNKHTSRVLNDEIQQELSLLFEDKVSPPYDETRLEEIFKEGEERYQQRVPPGYKDASKGGGSELFVDKCRKFGDLIIWNQVIEKSIESGLGVILVIDDKKEDWWTKPHGKTLGPRPELVKEFADKANNIFLMYQPDHFLVLAQEHLHEKVADEIVEEVREVRRRRVQQQHDINAEFDVGDYFENFDSYDFKDNPSRVNENIIKSLQFNKASMTEKINRMKSVQKSLPTLTADQLKVSNQIISNLVDERKALAVKIKELKNVQENFRFIFNDTNNLDFM